MKFSVSWLASYLPGPAPEVPLLRSKLTGAGFIVEGVEGAGPDAVLDVELTANRPDGMNHRGLAREAAAALGRAFADVEAGARVAEEGAAADALAAVRIDVPALCSRYSARVITGITVRPSPSAVRVRFGQLGLGPISAPVDATNHVLWDIGQPLHAFDLDKLEKGEDGRPLIVVRSARKGETLVTLDGVTRTLGPEHLVIADAKRPVALAGVMGGLETAIGDATRNILLESAHFDPSVVRRSARSFGMHTDASHRFERGTDPRATVDGLDRAARMIVAVCGGKVARGVVDAVAREIPLRKLALREAFLAASLGMTIPFGRAQAILEALGFGCRLEGPGLLEVVVPPWRIDVEGEIDLVEEVIRLVGYDTLPETLPPPFNPTRALSILDREERARDVLAGIGLIEAYTYSFVSEGENAPFATTAPGSPVTLANALGEPFTTMRASLAPGLLRTARNNVRRGLSDLGFFEVGRAWGREGADVREGRRVGILLCGAHARHWAEPPRNADFFDGSGAVAALFAGLGAAPPRLVRDDEPFLSPGRAARVVTAEGRNAGWVGILATALAEEWDLSDPVLAEVDLDAVAALPRQPSVEAPSRLPGSEVDLTVTHRLERSWDELSGAVRASAPAELVGIDVKYRWQGAGVAPGFVKTTLSLSFGSAERSLSREEVNGWRDAAARTLLAFADTRVDGIGME